MNYSFCGLKTSAKYYLENLSKEDRVTRKDFAASYQEAIVDSLLNIFKKAIKNTKVKTISGGGGVLANTRLREKLNEIASNSELNIYLPSVKLSTDNAAMICAAARKNLISSKESNDIRLKSVIS